MIILEAKTVNEEIIEFELEDLFGEYVDKCDRIFRVCGEFCYMDSIKLIKIE